MKRIAVAMVLVAAAAAAQNAAGPAPGSRQAPVEIVGSHAVRVYTNPELHMTFAYPAELGTRDASAVAVVGRRMINGADAESDPEHAKNDTCTKVLLSVGKEGGGGPAGARVTVALFDVDVRCLPARALKNRKAMDAVLTNLAMLGTTVMGLMPIEQPMFYEIQGRRVHFCAAQGQPVAKTDVQSAESEVIGVAAMATGGHVLSWLLESNDPATFNRLLGSQVDFGTGKPERLFPAQFR